MSSTGVHPSVEQGPGPWSLGRTRRPGDDSREVAPGVACVPLSIVNLYLVGAPGAGDRAWVLVDAGLPFSAGTIARAAERRFGPGSRPAAL